MTRAELLALLQQQRARQGRPAVEDLSQTTRAAGFRSLDFSELALRVELVIGRELAFDASALRAITTLDDVLDLLEELAK